MVIQETNIRCDRDLSYRRISCRQHADRSPFGSGSDIPDRRYQFCDSEHRCVHSLLDQCHRGYLLADQTNKHVTKINHKKTSSHSYMMSVKPL